MATATTSPVTYHLCSYLVRTGEQEYTVYELRSCDVPLTDKAYRRELLEFCLATRGKSLTEDDAEEIDEEFSEWAYDDRLYVDPWVQNVTKEEYEVLSKYLNCR